MHSKNTELHTSNLDVADIVKQAQQMRSRAVAEMIHAGWQGAQRVAKNLINSSGKNDHRVATPISTDR